MGEGKAWRRGGAVRGRGHGAARTFLSAEGRAAAPGGVGLWGGV